MKIEDLNKNAAAFWGMGGNEETVIQKKIQSLKKELGELEKKDELSQEEVKKKKELEQQIVELEQKLQQLKGEKAAEKAEKQDKEEDASEQLKEDEKGENIDERV